MPSSRSTGSSSITLRGRASPKRATLTRAGQRRSRGKGRPDDELTPALRSELERRLKDTRDPVRYMISVEYGHGFTMYYDVGIDAYVLKHIDRGTLFKRKAAALVVMALLGAPARLIRVMVLRGKIKRVTPELRRFPPRREHA